VLLPKLDIKDGDKLEVIVYVKDGDKTKTLNFKTSKKWMIDISESDGKKFGKQLLMNQIDEVLETDWEGVKVCEGMLKGSVTSLIGNTKTWEVYHKSGKTEGNIIFIMNVEKLKDGTGIRQCYILPSEEVV